MIRSLLICLPLLFGSLAHGQKRTFSISLENESFESVLELVSSSTGYLFAYNSEIAPQGSRFSIQVEEVTIEEFLNKFLLGTGLEHQMLQDQVIIKQTIIEPVIQERKVTFSVSGRVLDSLTNEPIPSVNVFLSGTNIGGVTDLDGYYSIDRIPVGTYEVIFSHLTYEMKTELVSRHSPGIKTVNAAMSVQLNVLDTVEVVSRRLIGPKERDRYIRIFENEFIGRSSISSRCKLLNPEVLDFIYDPENDKLEVFALEPLEIENDYLGYEITYVFETFQRVGNHVNFYGKARFDNLKPAFKREARQWLKNRRSVYEGSFLHFRRSLIKDELRSNNFRISLVQSADLSGVPTANEVSLSREDILMPQDNSSYTLAFDNFLKVVYRRKPDEEYKNQFYEERGSLNYQLSLLTIGDRPVILRANGRMEFPGVATYGYWYWERMGDLLPENYDPETDDFDILQ